MLRWLSFSVILSFLLISCSTSTTAVSPSSSKVPMNWDKILATNNSGQELPISASATVPNGTKIQLEVARTPQQQSMGLMYRPALPDNRGMLFQFSSPQPVSFWMKNVPVPLDMVFLNQGQVQYIAPSVPPCTTDPCPTYGPNKPVDMVIELRAGRAAELKLKAGDRLKIEFFNPSTSQS